MSGNGRDAEPVDTGGNQGVGDSALVLRIGAGGFAPVHGASRERSPSLCTVGHGYRLATYASSHGERDGSAWPELQWTHAAPPSAFDLGIPGCPPSTGRMERLPSTPIMDRNGEVRFGEVPENAVVVAGGRVDPDNPKLTLYAAVIAKYADAHTRGRITLNADVREARK